MNLFNERGLSMADNELNKVVENTEETVDETDNKGKFYTEEEIALIEQKAGDKRISQYQKTLEKKQREADRLRDMDADQRREYDYQQRVAALEAKEKEFAMLENKQAAVDVLINKGLDVSLVDLVVDADADIMDSRIKLLEKAFKKSVRTEVENRLKSKSPVQTIDTNKTYGKKDFATMPLAEMQALYESNPEVFDNK